MKSVKKFLNERMNSVDAAGAECGAGRKAPLENLKCSGAEPDSPAQTGDGYVSLPNTPLPLSAPIAVCDPSPSPSLADSAQNTQLCTLEEDASTASPATAPPTNGGAQSELATSPFTYPPAAQLTSAQPQRKSRRKISLPWFRQSSVNSGHGMLSRQHTIDTPSSFRLFRQPSNSGFKLGSQEATWVVADYMASAGSNELSVSKGQQVEIIEPPTVAEPDFCLVRLNPQHDDAAVQEGLVPVSVLKPAPSAHKQITSAAAAATATKITDAMQQEQGNRSKADGLSSSTKRRGFTGRKWFPGLKLSQSKVEKPPDKTIIKKPSEKNLRKHAEEAEQPSGAAKAATATPGSAIVGQMPSQFGNASSQQLQQDNEPEEEVGLELPPPMKPIQEPHLISGGPPDFNTDLKDSSAHLASAGKMDGNPLSEIEQIVREKTEQHESKSRVDVGSSSSSCVENASINGRAHASADLNLGYNSNDQDNNDENNTDASDSKAIALRKRQCALAELVSTEESYVQDLQEIVNGYMPETNNPNSDIPLPNDLNGGKKKLVFNNIKEIYEWHRDHFLKALRQCQRVPAGLGPLIKQSERKFPMYYYYCSNQPLSEFLVSAHSQYFDRIRQKLGHRMDLSNLIIKPVQRITKYELLLKEITQFTERAGLFDEVVILKEAYQQMKIVVKKIDDMMLVLRGLQDFDGEITAQGNLLQQGPLKCANDAGQKQRELQVILFQQTIIFADIEKVKTQYSKPTFKYRSHIQVNKMEMKELGDNRFLLKSTDPNRPDVNMMCQASTPASYQEWVKKLKEILENQDYLKLVLASPIEYMKQNNPKCVK